MQTSLVAHKSSRVRAVTTTPAERSGAYLARLPDHIGLPQTLWRVGFRGDLFGACTVFTFITARTLCFPPYRGIFLKCFRPFVASWPAPSASGRSESGRVGIAPTGLVYLRQGTHNVFIERLWRSVKYEDIYLRAYENGRNLQAGLTRYFDFYNRRRIHQSHGYRTPDEIYYATEAGEPLAIAA